MSTNLNYKQVENFSRRTWDVEEYEKKAKARQDATEDQATSTSSRKRKPASDGAAGAGAEAAGDGAAAADETKEEFLPADRGAACPEGSDRAFLKARKNKIDVEGKVGTTEMISAEQAAGAGSAAAAGADDKTSGVVKTGVGWHCKVCDCFLKDSHTYLDHINGRKHQRSLGFSMRVERSTKNQLLNKLSQLTKKKEEDEAKGDVLEDEPVNYDEVVAAKDEEEKRRKEERKRRRKERKKKLKQQMQEGGEQKGKADGDAEPKEGQPQDDNNDDDEVAEAEVDPAIAQMMGFSGFGG